MVPRISHWNYSQKLVNVRYNKYKDPNYQEENKNRGKKIDSIDGRKKKKQRVLDASYFLTEAQNEDYFEPIYKYYKP